MVQATYNEQDRCGAGAPEPYPWWSCSDIKGHYGPHRAYENHNIFSGPLLEVWEDVPEETIPVHVTRVGTAAPHYSATYIPQCNKKVPKYISTIDYTCSLQPGHSGPHESHWNDNISNDLTIPPWDDETVHDSYVISGSTTGRSEPKIVKIKRHSNDERIEMARREIAELGGMDAIDPKSLADDYLCMLANHVWSLMAVNRRDTSVLYDKLSNEKFRRNLTTEWEDDG